MAHRLTAFAILGVVSLAVWQAARELKRGSIRSLLTTWLCLVVLQAILGAATVWSNKAADVATAHVLVGALNLLTGCVLSVLLWRPAAASYRRSSNPALTTLASQSLPSASRPVSAT